MCFFFFKQKTAYEMRISDWSSDVCSSDLPEFRERKREANRRSQERRQADREGEPRLGRRRGPTEIDRHVGARVRARRRELPIPYVTLAEPPRAKPQTVAVNVRGEQYQTGGQFKHIMARSVGRVELSQDLVRLGKGRVV